jgi:hypothetical protein
MIIDEIIEQMNGIADVRTTLSFTLQIHFFS